jgi:hypothetical protein
MRYVTIQKETRANGDGEHYIVRFERRNKWQKHWAAQFDARYSTRADVVAWVNRQPNLTLKEHDNDPA